MRNKRWGSWVLLFTMPLMVMSGGCGGGDGVSGGGDWGSGGGSHFLMGPLPNNALASALQEYFDFGNENALTAKAVFLHGGYTNSLTGEDEAALRDAYGRGVPVVLIAPTWDHLDAVAGMTGAHLSLGMEAMNSSAEETVADIYAFINSDTAYHTYVLSTAPGIPGDLRRVVISEDVSTGISEDVTAQMPQDPVPIPDLTKDDYKERLDHFADWLNNGGAKPRDQQVSAQRIAGSLINAAGDKIENIVKAQTITFNYDAVAPWELVTEDKNPKFRPTTTYTNTYFIYAVYSKDQDYDYYIFDQESSIVNGRMWREGGLWYSSYWGKGEHTRNSGYYMTSFHNDHYLMSLAAGSSAHVTAGRFDILQSQPTTSIGSTSYTVSQSYNIGGSLGFNSSGPTGSITGGATYTSSKTTSISDVGVENRAGEPLNSSGVNNARWEYVVNNLPVAKNQSSGIHPYRSTITDPPKIAISTAIFYSSWIWRVKPEPNETFQVHCYYQPNYGYTRCMTDWWTYAPVWFRETASGGETKGAYISLIPPPRS